MFISGFLILFIIVVACFFVFIYSKTRKLKERLIKEAENRGDKKEAERLRKMTDDEIAGEFEEELSK